MPTITCSLDAITTSADCKLRGGIRTLYWAQYTDIDWSTMAGDPLQFDTANQEILGYTMLAAAVFTKVEFDRKNAFYDVTFTEDADVYAQIITMFFDGKDRARRNSLQAATLCCNIIAHVFDNNGNERIFGVDWNGDSFDKQLTSLKVGRHLDSSGQLGQSTARDELDLTGESFFAPLYGSVTEASIPV